MPLVPHLCVLRVDLDDAGEGVDANIPQVVAGALEEGGDALGSCERENGRGEGGEGGGGPSVLLRGEGKGS